MLSEFSVDRLLVGRAGLIEILELCGIEFINPPLQTLTGEYVGGDSIDRIIVLSIVRT